MATEDYSAALQALSILTDTATSFKKMEFASDEAERSFNRQQQASKEQFKMQADNQRDLMMLDNTLKLEQTSYSNYTNLLKEARELGVTYNDLKSPGAQKIYEEMTDEKVREIKEIKGNIHSLKGFNLELGNKISTRQAAQLDKADKLIELQTAESEAKTKSYGDASTLASLQVKAAKIEILKELRTGGNITLTGIVPESTDAALIAAEGKGGYEGLAVSQEWSNADLVSIANNAVIDYKDELAGIADYSDMNAWMEQAKVEAKEFARNNSGVAWLGVTQDDINNNTEAYQIFESKYLKAAEHGILNNSNYDKEYRSKGLVDKAKSVESQTLRVTNPEAYATLANVSQQINNYFGTTDADGEMELNVSKKEIKTFLAKLDQKGNKKNVNKVKNTMNQIMRSTDPEFIRAKLMESEEVRALISITSIGKAYMDYIMEVAAKLESQKSLRSTDFKGYTNKTINDMNTILQNNMNRNQ